MDDINNSILSLYKKFIKISQAGWIKGLGNGLGNVGVTFEKLLGKEIENFEWPDYEGIEIKTKTSLKNKYVTLFNATPDGKDFFECKRLWETYGYKKMQSSEEKTFCLSVLNDQKNCFSANHSASLEINYEEKKIYLCIYNFNTLIDKNSYWSFEMLKQKLYRKLKYLAVVDAISSKKLDGDYFKYNHITFYKLKDFNTFLHLIEKRIIKINFSISVFRFGTKKGKLHDHGTGFRLNSNYILELYDKIDNTKINK